MRKQISPRSLPIIYRDNLYIIAIKITILIVMSLEFFLATFFNPYSFIIKIGVNWV